MLLPAEPDRDGSWAVGDDIENVGLPLGQVVRFGDVVEYRAGVSGDEDVVGVMHGGLGTVAGCERDARTSRDVPASKQERRDHGEGSDEGGENGDCLDAVGERSAKGTRPA